MLILITGFHYVALALGVASLMQRKRLTASLALNFDSSILVRLFKNQTLWWIALVLSIATGLHRLFAGIEKPLAFYAQSPYFHIKMTLIFIVLLAEIMVSIRVYQWKKAINAGNQPQPQYLKSVKIVNAISFHIYLILPFVAAAMARGLKF